MLGRVQVEDIQLSLENGAVLASNELEQVPHSPPHHASHQVSDPIVMLCILIHMCVLVTRSHTMLDHHPKSYQNLTVAFVFSCHQVEMSLNLERHLRSKLGRWRENEYSNAATMEDWRNERENMQKVRHPHWHIDR